MKLSALFTALLLAAASIGSQAASVQLSSVGSTQLGQSFDLQLRLDDPFSGLSANDSLLSFGFHLGFDSSLLKLVSFTPASGWDDDSALLGADIYSASNFPGVANSAQASIPLATLHFDVLQAGSTSISLSTDAADFNQGLNYLFAAPQAFNVSTPLTLAPVPEPGALALMLAGLAGLVARRRGQGQARPRQLAGSAQA